MKSNHAKTGANLLLENGNGLTITPAVARALEVADADRLLEYVSTVVSHEEMDKARRRSGSLPSPFMLSELLASCDGTDLLVPALLKDPPELAARGDSAAHPELTAQPQRPPAGCDLATSWGLSDGLLHQQ